MTLDALLVLLGCIVIAAFATGFALGWRRRERELAALRDDCDSLRDELQTKSRLLAGAVERTEKVTGDLAALRESATQSELQIVQLRDLIKVHVARRREFDDWANPIREVLGEGIGQVMRKLKEQSAHQEFALKRQERIATEAQEQYRGKRDELEHMRRELTLKNYHIAALNERFIRIEERMQDLATQVGAVGGVTGAGMSDSPPAGRLPGASPDARDRSQVSPDTERFSVDLDGSKDWMNVLDDWHRQLHQRFDRLEALQGRLRSGAGKADNAPRAQPDRSGGGDGGA